jgi:hypothetical protein
MSIPLLLGQQQQQLKQLLSQGLPSVPRVAVFGVEKVFNFLSSSFLVSPDRVISPLSSEHGMTAAGDLTCELKTFSNSEYCELTTKLVIKATHILPITPGTLVESIQQRALFASLAEREGQEGEKRSIPPFPPAHVKLSMESDNIDIHSSRSSGSSSYPFQDSRDREYEALLALLSEMKMSDKFTTGSFSPKQHTMILVCRMRINPDRQIESIHFTQER